MPERHPALPADRLGEVAHLWIVEAAGLVAAVEVEVDVDVVLLRQLEHPAHLSGTIRVVADATPDHRRAAIKAGHEVLVRARHAGPALLQEHAGLDVDRPRVILLQLLDRLEAEQADVRVDLDLGAHVGHAMQQALLERAARAVVDVFRGERVLDRRGALHVVALHPVGLHRHAVDDQGLVEVEVALDQAR